MFKSRMVFILLTSKQVYLSHFFPIKQPSLFLQPRVETLLYYLHFDDNLLIYVDKANTVHIFGATTGNKEATLADLFIDYLKLEGTLYLNK